MQQLKPEQKEEVLRRIKRSAIFQRVFGGADGDFVLAELKKHLRPFDPDPYVNAYNCGIKDFLSFIDTILNQDIEKERAVLNAKTEEK